MLLAAVVVISPLAATEVWADLGFGVPRLGSVGILSFNAIVMAAALRFRLFDRANLGDKAFDGFKEGLGVDRLGQVTVHA